VNKSGATNADDRLAGEPGGSEIYLKIKEKFDCGPWFMGPPWSFFWICGSFPGCSWNELTSSERADIRSAFSGMTERPMLDLVLLDAMGLLDEFKAMANRAMAANMSPVRRKKDSAVPIFQGWPGHRHRAKQSNLHALFTFDLINNETQVLRQVRSWWRSPEIKQLRAAFTRSTAGTTGAYKDRLKDLASWRIYRALGYAQADRFITAHRKRDNLGRHRPFHDARQGQTEKVQLNEALLYSEESGFLKAKRRAVDWLKTKIPEEFATEEEQATSFSDAVMQRLDRRKISWPES
jgi:hypothetical protein